MTNPIDLDALKARSADPAPQQQQQQRVAEPPKPRLPPEREAEIARFSKDFQTANAPEQRIPLPAAPQQADPNVRQADAPKPEEPRQDGFRSTFDTSDRRAWLERSLRPMDFGELVLTGRVTQDVELLRGKMSVRYQSLLGEETFWMEQRARDMAGQTQASLMNATTWTAYARLALAVQSINGSPLASHIIQNGDVIAVDKDAVEKRIHQVLRMGERVVEMMLVNLGWFEERVTKLFDDDFEALKNG
jgi:hypothetical protein